MSLHRSCVPTEAGNPQGINKNANSCAQEGFRLIGQLNDLVKLVHICTEQGQEGAPPHISLFYFPYVSSLL
jgi:hypothetical protein